MSVRSWVCIIAVVATWGLSSDQPLLAQKKGKAAKTKESDSDSKSNGDRSDNPDDPTSLPEPDPTRPASPTESAVRQAQTAYQEGRFEQCIDLTTQVLDSNPRHSVARYHRASALVDLGRRDGAIEKVRAGIADAREALSIAGKQYLIFHIPYFYGMTSLAEMENRPAHAELTVKVATPLLQRPDLPRNVKSLVYYQRGLAKMFLQDFAGAAADYGEAIKIDPQFQAAHFGRADAFMKAGDPGKARESYDQAVVNLIDDPLVYNNRGTFQLQQGRIDGAISDFTKALELDDEFSMAALNRGFARAQQLDWFEAENDYLLALQADPKQALALRLLGMARMAQGKLTTAVEAYTKALAMNPQDVDAYSGRGFARFFAKDYVGAKTDFTKARQLNPNDTMVVPWKYWAETRAGQQGAARQEIEAFVQSQGATPNWHGVLCQYMLGKVDDQGLLKFASEANVASTKVQWLCEAHFFQGLQSEAANKPDVARQHFEESLKTNQSQLTAYIGAKLALGMK